MKIGIVTKCKDEFKNSSNPDIMPLCYAMLCYAMRGTISNFSTFLF